MTLKTLLIFLSCLGASLCQATLIEFSYLNVAKPGLEVNSNHVELKFNWKIDTESLDKKSTENRLDYQVETDLYGVTFFDYAISLPLLNVSYKLGDDRLSLGRRAAHTSLFLDDTWKFSLNTAHLRMDPFSPVAQGKLGLFYTLNAKAVTIEFFGSPISIPDQNPSYRFNNDRIKSDNPWAVLPPSTFRVEETGQVFQLNYVLSDDSIPELISSPQYGISFSIDTDQVQIDTIYSNRPSKQLSFSVDPKLISGAVVEVETFPFFLREHLFGVQVNSVWSKGVQVKNSFYALVVDSSELEDGVKYQTPIKDYFFVNTSLSFKVKRTSFEFAHLYIRERPFESPDVIYISDSKKFLHGNAAKISIEDKSFNKTILSLEALYALKEKGLNASARYTRNVNKKLSMYCSVQFIQDFQDDQVEGTSNFKEYASLDNVRVGARYVF